MVMLSKPLPKLRRADVRPELEVMLGDERAWFSKEAVWRCSRWNGLR